MAGRVIYCSLLSCCQLNDGGARELPCWTGLHYSCVCMDGVFMIKSLVISLEPSHFSALSLEHVNCEPPSSSVPLDFVL